MSRQPDDPAPEPEKLEKRPLMQYASAGVFIFQNSPCTRMMTIRICSTHWT